MNPQNVKGRVMSGSGKAPLAAMLLPAMILVAGLFGGGLILGFLQALGHLPAAGMDEITLKHFKNVIIDKDFPVSLGITFYVALTSTALAAALGTITALGLANLSEKNRVLNFIVQVPLTVPHLVIAVAVMFMLAPSGLVSRLLGAAGLIDSAAGFPLLVNDPWCVGIISTYVWKEAPFIALMVLAVLKSSGTELNEAARTLKAGRLKRLRYVTLPLIFPSLGAASLIVFAYSFGAFETPYLLGRTWPMTLPVWAYKRYADVDLMARPEGIATGLAIAGVVTACVVFSQVITQRARKRGAII